MSPQGINPADPDHPRELGRRGEEAAAQHLRRLGFRILDRNLRTRTCEIDILVAKPPLLVAVEVKTRSHHPAPELTLGAAQLARLRRGLAQLAHLYHPPPRWLRVDTIAVRRLSADTMEVLHFPGTEFSPSELRGRSHR